MLLVVFKNLNSCTGGTVGTGCEGKGFGCSVCWYQRRKRHAHGKVEVFTLVLCMMLGTASLPHVLIRYFTTASEKAARQTVGCSLIFICLLYLTAPALATFTKLSLLDPNLATGIIGKSFADAQSLDWVQKWSSVGFLKLVDGNGDGLLQINEFLMKGDIVVLATPEIAGLPYVISGLVAAGVLLPQCQLLMVCCWR